MARLARSIGPVDLSRLIELIKSGVSVDDTQRKCHAEFRTMWNYGWARIDTFLKQHPPLRPRAAATIGTAYFAATVCCLLHDVKVDVEAVCKPLLGVCLGMTYTDMFFDEASTTTAQKEALVKFINDRMAGDVSTQPHDAASRAADAAFALITAHAGFEHVLEALRQIIGTHHRSVLAPDQDLRATALKLGAQTGAAFAAIIAPGDAEFERMCQVLGAWMQLLDDAADVDDDALVGIQTHATDVLEKTGCMDSYWTLLAAVSAHAAQAIGSAADRRGLTLGTVARYGVLFTSGLSYAKLSPRMQVLDSRFDTEELVDLYKVWRESYETTVQSLHVSDLRGLIGRIVASFL